MVQFTTRKSNAYQKFEKKGVEFVSGLTESVLVLESPVRSGYWPLGGPNRDRDQLVFSPKPKMTGPNRYKPVTVS
jgi:hypothetical protein